MSVTELTKACINSFKYLSFFVNVMKYTFMDAFILTLKLEEKYKSSTLFQWSTLDIQL